MNDIKFRDLPDNIREAAKAAILQFSPELANLLPDLEKNHRNVFNLHSLFAWNKTPEGFHFWHDVHTHVKTIIITPEDLC